ncbi:hypothetical protein JIG36_47600 [Actinoplanes sp. LDG1-06]|uniref:Uncharacterized protein n=1 Tax=Paractinoplanes ovalisporus TaxID=2810368 RepID=A0ABS2ATJ0_9ACTN|nr:hypothetical protein [Actinoplanes ovalisporus]MBM2623188.1 hypothetical protein [Actinoplanes ovalisporus]
MTLAYTAAQARTMSPQFLQKRRTASRLATIDAYLFPAAVRQRVAATHDTLTTSGLDEAEAAARQWFRLAARHPRARTAMPSLITATLWRELAAQPTDYAQFCTEAFGHPLPLPDAPAAPPSALAETFRLAREDENCAPDALPLLFRIDQQLSIPGGHRYLADCGGRGVCHDLPGALCLMHVRGPGRLLRNRPRFGPPPGDANAGYGCSGGAACGGGGCGGQ